jgi:hypothetical protein
MNNGRSRNSTKTDDPASAGKDQPEEGERQRKKPDPERMRILRSLPLEVKQALTKEEADAILYESVWPDSLLRKLQDYLVEEDIH